MEPTLQPTHEPVSQPARGGEPAATPAPPERKTAGSVDDLLEQVVVRGASDLHVTVGSEPVVRVNGRLERLDEFARLSPEDTQRMLYRILSTEQQKHFEIKRQIDISYSIPGLARFRVNVYFQRESLGAAFRLIPAELKTLEQLGLPPVLKDFTTKPRGLVLVTGPTGSGKSTTLAAMIDEINRTRDGPHHDHRGSDRVPPPPQELHRQPARDRPRRDELRRGAARRAPPGPRRDPPRRDARPRDDRDRAHRGRDRPPRLRHAAHAGRALHGRPPDRRLPGRAAGADPRADRRRRSRASSRRRSCRPPTARAASPRSRSCSRTTPSATSSARRRSSRSTRSCRPTRSRGMQTLEQALLDLVTQRQDHRRGSRSSAPAGPTSCSASSSATARRRRARPGTCGWPEVGSRRGEEDRRTQARRLAAERRARRP